MQQSRPVGFFAGKSLGTCQRCGRVKFTGELRQEWTNLRVCDDCWDPRPPHLTAPHVYPEGVPVPNASPEVEPVFVSDTLGPEDL